MQYHTGESILMLNIISNLGELKYEYKMKLQGNVYYGEEQFIYLNRIIVRRFTMFYDVT